MSKTVKIKKATWKFYFLEGILTSVWLVYLLDFYSFYNESYFYTDKRLPIFFRLISFLNDNWQELFSYFVLSFLFMSLTLFLTYYLYLSNKEQMKGYKIFCFLNVGYCLALLGNICGMLFFILFILAASLIYIIFVLADGKSYQNELQDDELIERKGPFETEEAAQKESSLFKSQWVKIEGSHLVDVIYLEADGKYYVEMYIEPIENEYLNYSK
ncbi:hypothetical protein [Enterococcus rotai]|uniref:hypothetical protein n=1 Tax=Enterococcus rotai TaxID=118060 RepID=UPI0032B3F327